MTQPTEGTRDDYGAPGQQGAASSRMSPLVWVVDDDQMILDAVRLVLEGEGYRVETSSDGSLVRALHEGRRAAPDMIVLDVLLAAEDGLDLCRLIKDSDRTRHIPVVLFSANSRTGPRAASECGDEYLQKPFDIDDLIAVVRRYAGPADSSPMTGDG